MLHFLQIQNKFIQPQARPLSDGRRLCRLEMRKAKRRLIFIFARKSGKCRNDIYKLFVHQTQCIPHDDNVRIVTHIAAGCSKVNDSLGLRALQTVRVYMAHHVMTNHLFSCLCLFVIDVLRMGLELINLFLCNIEAQLLLGFRKSDPKLSPCPEFLVRGENILHLLAGIPCREGTFILVVCHIWNLLSSFLRFLQS